MADDDSSRTTGDATPRTTGERNRITGDSNRLGALTGPLFVLLIIVGFAVGGEPPDAKAENAQEIVDFWSSDGTKRGISAVLEGLAAAVFVFFGGYLRRALDTAQAGRGWLPAVAFAGTIIVAVGLAIDATISVALIDTADDIDPAAAQALSALWNNDFVPMAVGAFLFLLATGLSVVRHGGLPKWIGWVAIALCVIAPTPIGFVTAIGGALLAAVIGVVLAMRAGKDTAAA